MSTIQPETRIAILGTLLLCAVIAAGCASSPYGAAPTTPAVTTPPATPPSTLAGTTAATTTSTPPATSTTAVQAPLPPTFATVTIENFTFIPASVTVPLGSTVTWNNQDAAAHQIASDTHAFMSQPLSQGSIYSFTFMTRGTFPYHCAIHPYMKGTITVT